MTKGKLRFCAKMLSLVAVVFVILLIGSGRAKADIFEIEAATGCGGGGSVGGGLCTSSDTAFDLSTLLSGGISISAGTEKFVVYNDIGNTFSLGFTGSTADNASCQINGGAASFFNACTITDSLGQTTSLGGPQIGGGGKYFTPAATITFSGADGYGQTFDLGFVSMQGTGTVSTPEGGSAALYLVLDISAFLALAGLQHCRRASQFPSVTSERAGS
jgi:hypothetical protein